MIVDRNRFGDSEIKSCKQCGRRLHPKYNKDICPACMEMNLFNEVKDYIRKNDVNESQVADHFGISNAHGSVKVVFSTKIQMAKQCRRCIVRSAVSRWISGIYVPNVVICRDWKLLQSVMEKRKDRCVSLTKTRREITAIIIECCSKISNNRKKIY